MDFTAEDYQALQEKLLSAAQKMKSDAWWLNEEQQPGRDKTMRFQLRREMVGSLVQVPKPLKGFYAEIMQRKRDDHLASHSNVVNQFFHLLSSSVFIYCYFLIFVDLTQAMCLGLAALFVRQCGHAILEPPCHEKEALLLGFNTRNKTLIVAGYLFIPIVHLVKAGSVTVATFSSMAPAVALQWFGLTVAVVVGHVAYLVWEYNVRSSMIWFVKLATDPFTDIVAYYSSPYRLLLPLQARKNGTV
jgi:glutamate-1-semialdehyde 2,1-aminomutase